MLLDELSRFRILGKSITISHLTFSKLRKVEQKIDLILNNVLLKFLIISVITCTY